MFARHRAHLKKMSSAISSQRQSKVTSRSFHTISFSQKYLATFIFNLYLVRCTDSRDCKSLTIENEKWFCGFTNDGQVKGYCNKCESSSISYPNPCENPKTLSPSDFWEKSRTIEECKLNCPGGSHIFPQIDNQ